MKDQAEIPEALALAERLENDVWEAVPLRLSKVVMLAAEALRRLHAESEKHLQELRSYRITVENREARIAELEAQLAAAQPVFSHMELRADGSHGAGRAVAVDTMGREMPGYNPTAAARQGVQQSIEQDVRAIVDLLKNREWAEHIGQTELGRELEHEITKLYNTTHPTPQGLDAQTIKHISALSELVRMPNAEHFADAHNAAVRHLRAIAAQAKQGEQANG